MKPIKVRMIIFPLVCLLYSRKFLLLLLDGAVCTVLYFVGKYAGPSTLQDVKFLIGVLQPVVIAVILAIAHEDAAAKRG